MAADEVLRRKLTALWPDPVERERVLAELLGYGQESHEREADRVRLAIVKLSEGRRDRLTAMVAAARRDYRDVLMWAEYPSEGQSVWTARHDVSTEDRRRLEEMRREDLRQYQAWLKE
jgi:hypothetical protein